MTAMKLSSTPTVVATVIGDLVGSRTRADRHTVHRAVSTALDAVTASHEPVEPLRVTAGDEFQGVFADVGSAIDAALTLRLDLQSAIQSRYGIGWGEVTLLDDTDRTQDGPGWWAARDAIEWVADAQREAVTAHVRTAYRCRHPRGPSEDAVNAALHCRDHLIGSGDDRARRILAGLMAGRTQAQIAADEGISASAVSQRVRGDGPGLLLLTRDLLREVR